MTQKRKNTLFILMALLILCSAVCLSGIAKVLAEKKAGFSKPYEYAARINSTYYITLEEAIAEAVDKDTVYILKDIDLSGMIDTNGLDLTLAGEPGGDIYTIKRGTDFKKFNNGYYEYDNLFFINGGHFTINDLIIDGGAVWNEHGDNIGAVSNSVMIHLYYGTMTLNDVILQNNDNAADTPSESYAGAVGVGIEADLIMERCGIRYNRTKGGGGAVESSGGKISMYDVIITKNTAGVGGAFYLWEGSLYLKDSEISQNMTEDGSGGAVYSIGCDIQIENSRLTDNVADLHGGGISLHSGSLKMIHSELSRNTAGMNGGAVDASGIDEDSRVFQIKDSKIIGNYSTGDGGGIYYEFPKKLELSGDVAITSNHNGGIYLADSRYPIFLADQLKVTDRIGITVDNSSYLLGDTVVDGSGLSEGAGIEDFYHEGGRHCLDGSGKNLMLGLTQNEYEARIDDEYFKYLEDAVIAADDGDSIYLLKNIIQRECNILSKQIAIISEHGGLYQIKRGGNLMFPIFSITNNGALLLRDIVLDGGAEWIMDENGRYLNSGIKTYESLVMVEGRFTMESGAVLTNNDIYMEEYEHGCGSGVYVYFTGTFIMEGGEITGNAIRTKKGHGAGVYNIGAFELRGGRITNNVLDSTDSAFGAGIYNTAEFTFYDGEISGNTGSANGGGIFSGNSFTMYGGRIAKNIVTVKSTEDYGGGGVLIYGSGNTFMMEGGEIVSNAVTNDSGGGISVYYGNFIMKDGIINDNTAEESGGGVRVHFGCAVFRMIGGAINDNRAGGSGGGICLTEGAVLDFSGGEITNNRAGTGGGIAISRGTLSLAGNVGIYKNKNGDVYLHTEGKPIILKENIAALKPIGLIVSVSYKKGDSVIDGTSHSIDGSLDDFYYASLEHSLSKNMLDIELSMDFHITYDGNGNTEGHAPRDAADYKEGDAAIIKDSGSLKRTGYTFAGWNTQADGLGTAYEEGSQLLIMESITLYAVWESDICPPAEYYMVTYHADGDISEREADIIESGYNVSLPDAVREGYVFNGWHTQQGGTGRVGTAGDLYKPIADIDLYAGWLEKELDGGNTERDKQVDNKAEENITVENDKEEIRHDKGSQNNENKDDGISMNKQDNCTEEDNRQDISKQDDNEKCYEDNHIDDEILCDEISCNETTNELTTVRNMQNSKAIGRIKKAL